MSSEQQLINQLIAKKRKGVITPEEEALLNDLKQKHLIGAIGGIITIIVTLISIYVIWVLMH